MREPIDKFQTLHPQKSIFFLSTYGILTEVNSKENLSKFNEVERVHSIFFKYKT